MGKIKSFGIVGLCCVLIGGVVASSVNASSPSDVIQRIDVNPSGQSGYNTYNAYGSADPSISRDGRFVAFSSNFQNLVTSPVVTGQYRQIYVRDRLNDTTRMVSIDNNGAVGNNVSILPRISADGRYVVFVSYATNLTSIASGANAHIYRYDLANSTVGMVDYNGTSLQTASSSNRPSISSDGKYVAFESSASNLDPSYTVNSQQVYVRNMQTGGIKLISKNRAGGTLNAMATLGSIDCSGSKVLFTTSATSLVSTGSLYWNKENAYVADTVDGTIATVTDDANDNVVRASLACSGDYVTYVTQASNIFVKNTQPVGTNMEQAYLFDVIKKTNTIVSKSSSGNLANSGIIFSGVSDEGRYVVFNSSATNLVSQSVSGSNVYLRDTLSNVTSLITLSNNSQSASGDMPFISPNAEYVGFMSTAGNLMAAPQSDPAGGANGLGYRKGSIYVRQTGQNYTY